MKQLKEIQSNKTIQKKSQKEAFNSKNKIKRGSSKKGSNIQPHKKVQADIIQEVLVKKQASQSNKLKASNKQLEDIEIKDISEMMDDQMVKQLASINSKKVQTNQEKERRINEFKFRIVDLLNIFVETSKQSQSIYNNLSKLCGIVQKLQKDKSQAIYIQRLIKIIKNSLNKFQETSPEQFDQLQQSAEQILQSINRCTNRQIISSLEIIYEIILKVIGKNTGQQSKKVIIKSVNQAVTLFGTKRQSMVNSKFLKKILKIFPFTSPRVFRQAVQLSLFSSDITKERKRPELLDLCSYMNKNKNLQQELMQDKHFPTSQELLFQLVQEVMDSIGQQKYQQITVLRRTLQTAQSLFEATDQDQSEKFKLLLKQKVLEDQQLQSVINRILQ